ncbi:uncharacterized protein LOC125488933 [Plutella xylostella]|uniref:uncharacterized protein LOC125488933 n=1 Tax=Plutella xylostella TaxID=51655 RepID=UPI0018CFFB83|nr:uncharacterized protein LOC125488933 [Plutella xylostella]
MSSNASAFSIDKLIGRDNYSTWKFAVQTYLEHEELWECVEGTNVDQKKDKKAKSKIILLVDPINYVHIEECTTSKELLFQLFQLTMKTTGILILEHLHICLDIECGWKMRRHPRYPMCEWQMIRC